MDKEKKVKIKLIINAVLLIIIGFLALVLIAIVSQQKNEIKKMRKEIVQLRVARQVLRAIKKQ
jgi:type II secretory pathway pseudopilin PulG